MRELAIHFRMSATMRRRRLCVGMLTKFFDGQHQPAPQDKLSLKPPGDAKS